MAVSLHPAGLAFAAVLLNAAALSAQAEPASEPADSPASFDEPPADTTPTEPPPPSQGYGQPPPPAADVPPAAPPAAPTPAPPAPAATEPAPAAAPPAQPYPAPPAYVEPPPPSPPPPPPEEGDGGFELPAFSVRVDPINWLLEGLLGFELEVQAYEFITVELVPVFVTSTEPPVLNLAGREDTLSRHSNGIGALAGTSIGVGFWLSGEPFRGTVLRAVFRNHGYTYRTEDGAGVIDEFDFTERQLLGFIGSYSRFGPFMLGGGLLFGAELNRESRCFNALDQPTTQGCDDDEQLIVTGRQPREVTEIRDWMYPIVLDFRLSLGVAF